jgi:hypothetical protein
VVPLVGAFGRSKLNNYLFDRFSEGFVEAATRTR